MSNRAALGLGLAILVALALDQVANSGAGLLFLAQRFVELIDYVAFWR